MQKTISTTVTNVLKKELSYADFAVNLLRNEMKVFEKEYDMNSTRFVDKFEKGQLGDERVWFDWYGLALSLKDWNDTKTEIKKTLRIA